METAAEIVKKATAMRKVIAAAIILTNSRFESQKRKIFLVPTEDDIASDIKSFRAALDSSTLSQNKKEILSDANDQQICDLAKDITITFTCKEIRIH